jgi:hypothetical protein
VPPKTAPRTTKTTRAKKPAPQMSARIRKDRSFRQVVGRIDVWSVLKVSLCFHTAAMLTTVVAIIVCWTAASAVGIIKNLEKFLGTVFEIKNFSFINFEVLQGVLLIGFVFVALMTILSVMAAALYNVFAEAVGGVEIYVVEETTGAKV